MKDKRPSFDDFKREASQQEGFVEEYNRLKPEFDLTSQLIVARKKAKVSQAELAKIMHTQQPAIARFENGGFTKSSVGKLQEYANALGYELHIDLIRKKHHKNDALNKSKPKPKPKPKPRPEDNHRSASA